MTQHALTCEAKLPKLRLHYVSGNDKTENLPTSYLPPECSLSKNVSSHLADHVLEMLQGSRPHVPTIYISGFPKDQFTSASCCGLLNYDTKNAAYIFSYLSTLSETRSMQRQDRMLSDWLLPTLTEVYYSRR